MMQREIDAAAPRRRVHIAGVADLASEGRTANITMMRSIAMLQDTATMNVSVAWRTTLRDVVVLDAENRRIHVYNLTEHNLADPANYAALKTMLLDAANAP